jgi:hypothetical protein
MIMISLIDNSFTVEALAVRVRQTLDDGESQLQ